MKYILIALLALNLSISMQAQAEEGSNGSAEDTIPYQLTSFEMLAFQVEAGDAFIATEGSELESE